MTTTSFNTSHSHYFLKELLSLNGFLNINRPKLKTEKKSSLPGYKPFVRKKNKPFWLISLRSCISFSSIKVACYTTG